MTPISRSPFGVIVSAALLWRFGGQATGSFYTTAFIAGNVLG